jgi:hypothetical protein
MAFGRTKDVALSDAVTPRRPVNSLVASAIKVSFDDASYNTYRFRDESWQRELWRLYDIVPEFAYAARWVGNCCSQVRIYVANVDKYGRPQQETDKPKIQALSDSLLGGPADKAEALRSLGINLTVAGEGYVLGDSSNKRDQWYILSSSEIRRVRGRNGQWDWAWGDKGMPMKLDLASMMITRVWTPHPARIWCADSPSRSCQPVLRELEQLTKYVFSQIDSRLVGAGLLIIPNNLDFPDDESGNSAGDSLMIRLATAGAQSMRGEGSAMGVLPHIIEANPEDIERGFKLVSFASELSKQALELRAEAIRRLGLGMDMPSEVLSGLGESNHWSGWLIDGYGIKVHIEPLMNRICQALTKAYLEPALKIMGEDPARFTFAYDTSGLSVRPQRLQDALNLYEKNIINAEAVRTAGFFKESDAQDVDESAEVFLREVILRDPQLMQNQAIREAAGIPEELVPQDSMVVPTPGGTMGGSGAPPPPPPPTGIQSELPPPIPDTLGQAGAPPAPPGPGAVTASVGVNQMALIVLAEATVHRALELAGKRLLDRQNRNQFPDVPHFDLHTRIRVLDQVHATKLLAGAWDQLPNVCAVLGAGVDVVRLQESLTSYCNTLLIQSYPHEARALMTHLQRTGLVSG